MNEQSDDTTQHLPVSPSPKRLHRSSDQKLFLGVCGGLAEYFDIDPTIVRLAFVIGTLLVGSSILLYVLLALIMPAEPMLDAHPREAARSTVDEAAAELQRLADRTVAETKRVLGRR
jgi:phage shock protein PspC (stress-responsive transcriptional regulator)